MSWNNFTTDILQANRVRKILAKQGEYTTSSLRNTDGTLTTTESERNNILLQTHFPGSVLTQQVTWPEQSFTPEAKDWQEAGKTVTEDKVAWAVYRFAAYKAAGTDEIFPALLQ
jgi:hypothetical protein